MTRRTQAPGEVTDEVTVEVRLRLHAARANETVEIRGALDTGDGNVTFEGWLDLLDALERQAERALGGGPATAGGERDGDEHAHRA